MRPWVLIVLSIIIQSAAFLLGVLYLEGTPQASPLTMVALPTGIIILFALLLRFPISWAAFNSLVPIALFLLQENVLAPWFFLAGFLILLSLHLPAFWTHVPYYPTPVLVYETVLKLLPEGKPVSFIDIGCGMGGLLSYLSKKRPDCSFHGVEIGIWPFIASLLGNLGNKNVSIFFKSFWKVDLGRYDCIYAFLSPAPMKELGEKFQAEALPGTILVSNSFEIPETTASEKLCTGTQRGMTLFVYKRVTPR